MATKTRKLIPQEVLDQAAQVLKVLAHPDRMRMVELLMDDEYTVGDDPILDHRLLPFDVQGSRAHARMLRSIDVLDGDELTAVEGALDAALSAWESGEFVIRREDEDVHTALERFLVDRIGDAGKKIHTGRSRNDQVLVDLRLWQRAAVAEVVEALASAAQAFERAAQRGAGVPLPGYTHLQHAQPVLFSHHIMSYFFMLNRDAQRLRDCLKRINVMPLGACALAGTSLPIDRKYVARLLGFSSVSENSIDTVSDRDFAIETLGHLVLIMVHLSRLSEELILWSS